MAISSTGTKQLYLAARWCTASLALLNTRLIEDLWTQPMDSKGLPDKACFAWLSLSPNLMPCDFYLWGFIKDCVYVPPLPADLPD
ncbi:hypothetical protein TNCV_4527161 [Trichonephila clavipes]|nr:hypothetical protein TNCV_4527161 [Trichonephila clavipes]